MKKYLIVIAACTLVACGGNNNNNEKSAEVERVNEAIAEETITSQPAQTGTQDEGRELIASSDCVACHKEEEKLIGPGYKEVAAKYEPNDTTVTYLANKIIQGGAGNWGNVPMTPHPQFSEEEASKMVRYILSLN